MGRKCMQAFLSHQPELAISFRANKSNEKMASASRGGDGLLNLEATRKSKATNNTNVKRLANMYSR